MGPRLNEQDIHAACAELVAMGEKPTSLVILERLGRGGLGTITKYMKTWQQTDEAKSAKAESLPAVVPLPEKLSKDGDDLVKKLWNVAKSISDAEIEGEREVMRQTQIAAEEKVNEAYEFSEVQSNKLEKLGDEFKNITGENDSLKADLSTTRQQLKTALEDKKVLDAELSEAIVQAKSLTGIISGLEQSVALIEQEKKQLQGIIADKDKALEKTKADHEKAISKLEAAHNQAVLKLEAGHEKIVLKLEADGKEALDRLENAHSSAMQAINISHHQALEGLEKARKEAVSQYKSTIADLNKDKEALSLLVKELQARPVTNIETKP
jgi:chromosome segregation ATPase